MSSTIRQNPSERIGTRQTRELDEQGSAVRRLQTQENDVNAREPNLTRETTARLNQLVDRATERPNTTSQSEAGRSTSTIGATGAAPLGRTNAVDELAGHQQVFGTAETRLRPATAPRVQLTETQRVAAETFAQNLGIAIDSAVVDARQRAANVPTAGELVINRSVSGLSPDELLAAFLKLNINDPNENVETHNRLYQFSTNMRQQAIEDAKKKSETAREMKKEAEAYAKQAEMISVVVTVVSIVLTIFTFGAAAPLGAAAISASAGAGAAASGVAAGAAAGANAAASTAIQTAGKTATDAAVKAAVESFKEAFKEAATKMSTEGMKEAIVQSSRQAATNLFNGLSTEAQNVAVQTVIDEAAKQGVQLSADAAKEIVINEMARQLTPQIAMQAFASGAITMPSQGVMMATSAALQGVSAGANYKAADKMIDAKEATLGATRARVRADREQERIQDEAEIINTIMEQKNQTIEAVMQMTNATWSSRQQLMAASVAR